MKRVKLLFDDNVALTRESERRSWFLIPRSCTDVGTVLRVIGKQFCSVPSAVSQLELEGFVLRNSDGIDIIREGDTILVKGSAEHSRASPTDLKRRKLSLKRSSSSSADEEDSSSSSSESSSSSASSTSSSSSSSDDEAISSDSSSSTEEEATSSSSSEEAISKPVASSLASHSRVTPTTRVSTPPVARVNLSPSGRGRGVRPLESSEALGPPIGMFTPRDDKPLSPLGRGRGSGKRKRGKRGRGKGRGRQVDAEQKKSVSLLPTPAGSLQHTSGDSAYQFRSTVYSGGVPVARGAPGAAAAKPEKPAASNFDALPDYPRGVANVGDVVAYKILQMEEGGPVLSGYKEAKVVGYDRATTMASLHATSPASLPLDGVSLGGSSPADICYVCVDNMQDVKLVKLHT